MLVTILLSLTGALLSRWYGSHSRFPRIIRAGVYCAPYGLISWLVLEDTAQWVVDTLITVSPLFDRFDTTESWTLAVRGALAVLVWSICLPFKVTGHGRGREMPEPMKEGANPEKIEILIHWLEPLVPTYWYKFTIMSLSGFLLALAPAVSFYSEPWCALVLASGGLAKGPACALGFIIPWGPKVMGLDNADARGEFLSGAFAWASIAICFMIL